MPFCFLKVVLVSFSVLMQTHTLEIGITGIKKKKGFLMAEIKNEQGKVVKQIKQEVEAHGSDILIGSLPAGRYAVAVFHDANSDGKLNTNLVGMPTESYGFSNNARGVFGPPSLADQLFSVGPGSKISIALK